MSTLPPSPFLSSAPVAQVSHSSGESDPSVMAGSAEAETRFVLDEARFMADIDEPPLVMLGMHTHSSDPPKE